MLIFVKHKNQVTMKTEQQINEVKQNDLEFIISAVTSELHDMANLRYFDTWENEGGMQWFFDECVEISKKVMFTEGSKYMEWLDYWTKSEEEHAQTFSEFTSESLDWYHMTEAMKEFKSRYAEDECTKDQISESIGCLINQFKTDEARAEVMAMGVKYAEERRESIKLGKIIQDLKAINADASTLEDIKRRLGIK
tara:strand:+ start:2355 stop:2939 length:585 start_codon:yes stop_codon:yes gene_type:complete